MSYDLYFGRKKLIFIIYMNSRYLNTIRVYPNKISNGKLVLLTGPKAMAALIVRVNESGTLKIIRQAFSKAHIYFNSSIDSDLEHLRVKYIQWKKRQSG